MQRLIVLGCVFLLVKLRCDASSCGALLRQDRRHEPAVADSAGGAGGDRGDDHAAPLPLPAQIPGAQVPLHRGGDA